MGKKNIQTLIEQIARIIDICSSNHGAGIFSIIFYNLWNTQMNMESIHRTNVWIYNQLNKRRSKTDFECIVSDCVRLCRGKKNNEKIANSCQLARHCYMFTVIVCTTRNWFLMFVVFFVIFCYFWFFVFVWFAILKSISFMFWCNARARLL